MAWMDVPAALSNRLWARLRARNAVSSFMVFSKSARCSSLKGCTYLTIITSSGRGEYATKSGLTLMRYCISIVSKNFWSGTYEGLPSHAFPQHHVPRFLPPGHMQYRLCQIDAHYAKMLLHWTRLLWSKDFLFGNHSGSLEPCRHGGGSMP